MDLPTFWFGKDSPDFELPDHWTDTEKALFIDMTDGNPVMASDEVLQMYYHATFFAGVNGERQANIYERLVTYMDDEYEIEMDDVFDWEAFAEWYEATH